MMKHKCISIDSPGEWNEALKGIRHSFSHTRESCYAMQLTTGYRTFLYCYENEDVKIVCALFDCQVECNANHLCFYILVHSD